ncbi:hypothetical protein LSAT2_025493 [Lamellibrachia satsuma]|nr:hypothetical protein LSAT2_025493 [Lamellibrachia satsuma]
MASLSTFQLAFSLWIAILVRCHDGPFLKQQLVPSQHTVIRADISGLQAAMLGTLLPITARLPAADAALALARGGCRCWADKFAALGPMLSRWTKLTSARRRMPILDR